MTTEVTAFADAVDGLVDCGDALINFSIEAIPCSVPFMTFAHDGSASLKSGAAMPVGNSADAGRAMSLLSDDIRRFVVISNGGSAAAEFAAQLAAAEVPHLLVLLTEDCTADAFMDEEDSEAVAERLRQLGYI